ncbi:hypothetical protein [Mycobacterium kansasii]|nr:hypothetical protein [Mycobacterium kansasii]
MATVTPSIGRVAGPLNNGSSRVGLLSRGDLFEYLPDLAYRVGGQPP